VGASLGGFVGALVATPLVAVVHVLLSSKAPRDDPAFQSPPVPAIQPEGVMT
jgi:predicted PurR-regulated permease PerM